MDKSINVFFTVTKRTTFNKVLEFSWNTPATTWVGKVEWQEEVVGLLEVRTNGVDFMNKIFNADNTVLTKSSFNDVVVETESLVVDLTVSTLVDKLADGSKTRVTVSNVWFYETEKFFSGLGDTDEGTIVDLEKSEKLENLAWLGCNLVDTLNSDNKDELWLSRDVERAFSTGSTLLFNEITGSGFVFLFIGSSTFVDDLVLLFKSLF